MLTHTFGPVYDSGSRILILGTFPSVLSREEGFYYGNPRNRFWQVLADVFGRDRPLTNREKTEFLLSNGIALWDVIRCCDITGSADSKIKNILPNDLEAVLSESRIGRIYANGRTAGRLYDRYIRPTTGCDITILPSTSPANASWTLTRLADAWSRIRYGI